MTSTDLDRIQIRVYEPEDYEMVQEWHRGHKHRSPYPLFSKDLFPPIGQVAFRENNGEPEDLAVLWLYLPIGKVCFLEHGISKPGIGLATVKQAFFALETCLKQVAHNMGYSIMIMHTIPAISRYATQRGWVVSESGIVSLFSPCAGTS